MLLITLKKMKDWRLYRQDKLLSFIVAKLVLIVLTEPQSSWSFVVRIKYCEGRCDTDMLKDRKDTSNSWKDILKSVAVDNGSNTRFWRHQHATNGRGGYCGTSKYY